MANPISMDRLHRDAREVLISKLQNAPAEHAEALLAAYGILQGLHDRGVLDLVHGALGSGDKVLEIVVDAMKAPESIRGIRNFVVLIKLLGTTEPRLVEGPAPPLGGALEVG